MEHYERIIGNKRVTNAPLPNFITVKNREIFDKKEIADTFNSYFVNIGPNLAASIPESKTLFQNYIHYNGPCLSTINLADLKLEKVQGMMIYLPMLSKECPTKYLLF